MSDMFDHELDAWEDKIRRDYHDAVEGSGSPPNPLFYHMKIVYSEILEETARALRLEYIHDMGRGTIWGNPYIVGKDGDLNEVLELYRKHLWNQIKLGIITKQMLVNLDGKRLACSCKPKPCHVDIIIKAIDWALEEEI